MILNIYINTRLALFQNPSGRTSSSSSSSKHKQGLEEEQKQGQQLDENSSESKGSKCVYCEGAHGHGDYFIQDRH